MSLEHDVTILREEEIFKPVSKRERLTRAEQRRKDVLDRKNPNIDRCPHCKADLREVGAHISVTIDGYEGLVYKDYGWVRGNVEETDRDYDTFRCNKCDGELQPGTDEFDPLEDNINFQE